MDHNSEALNKKNSPDSKKLPREFEQNLRPPLSTTFFSYAQNQVFDNQYLTDGLYEYNLTWGIEQFRYGVNGDPSDSSFASKGGYIYLIVVHTIIVEIGRNPIDLAKLQFSVHQKNDDSIRAALQLPGTNSGKADDNGDMEYTISYKETLQLLTDQGSNVVEFPAAYVESLKLHNTKQSGDTEGSKIDFKLSPSDNSTIGLFWDSGTRIQSRALSVFKNQDINAWPATFTFDHSLAMNPDKPYISKSVDIHVDPGFASTL